MANATPDADPTGLGRNPTVGVKRQVLERDGHRCRYCGRSLWPPELNLAASLTYDHVVPWAAGGSSHVDNVVAACRRCNMAKGDQVPTGRWRPAGWVHTPACERPAPVPVSPWVPLVPKVPPPRRPRQPLDTDRSPVVPGEAGWMEF